MIKVLGIHSSPINKGNTAWVLDYALQEAEKVEGVKDDAEGLYSTKLLVREAIRTVKQFKN